MGLLKTIKFDFFFNISRDNAMGISSWGGDPRMFMCMIHQFLKSIISIQENILKFKTLIQFYSSYY